jgi:hypothetical protein
MIPFGPRPLLFDTPLHPDAGRAFIFELSFFYHVAIFISVMPDLHLETLHNHTLGIDTCMVAFFLLFSSSFCLSCISGTRNHIPLWSDLPALTSMEVVHSFTAFSLSSNVLNIRF